MRRTFGRGRAISLFSLGTMRALGSADQMAEDMPKELVEDVNDQLAARGCNYRVSDRVRQERRSASAC